MSNIYALAFTASEKIIFEDLSFGCHSYQSSAWNKFLNKRKMIKGSLLQSFDIIDLMV
jgi:hypothetical protein